MKRVSPERKTSILAKLLPPYNMTVTAVAQMEGISEATLYNWRNQGKTGAGSRENNRSVVSSFSYVRFLLFIFKTTNDIHPSFKYFYNIFRKIAV